MALTKEEGQAASGGSWSVPEATRTRTNGHQWIAQALGSTRRPLDERRPTHAFAVEEAGAALHDNADLPSPAWKKMARECVVAEQQAIQLKNDERVARGQFRRELLKIWYQRHLVPRVPNLQSVMRL